MSTLSSAITASASALSAERTRIEVAVSNMANAESTRGPDGQPYRRRDVVLAPDERSSFDTALGKANAVGVKVAAVVEDQAPFRRRYEPSHPDADAEGFVPLPNVEPQNEMVDLIGASRAYQANLAAISLIRDLVSRSRWSSDGKRCHPLSRASARLETDPIARATARRRDRADGRRRQSFGESLDEPRRERRADRRRCQQPCRTCSTSPATCTTR